MTAPVFVDTNVFIYSLDEVDPKKYKAAQMWRAELWESRRGRISYQVLQEFYAKAMQKWPVWRVKIQGEVRDLLEWHPVSVDGDILELAWRMQDRYKISFWDALIVSAAKAASCRYLLTEDLQADQDLDGVVVVNPFRSEPGEILST